MCAASSWNLRDGRSCKYVSGTPAHVVMLFPLFECVHVCGICHGFSFSLKVGDVAIFCKRKAQKCLGSHYGHSRVFLNVVYQSSGSHNLLLEHQKTLQNYNKHLMFPPAIKDSSDTSVTSAWTDGALSRLSTLTRIFQPQNFPADGGNENSQFLIRNVLSLQD